MPPIIRDEEEDKGKEDKEEGKEEDKKEEEEEEEKLIELQSICISINVLPSLRYRSIVALLVGRNPSYN